MKDLHGKPFMPTNLAKRVFNAINFVAINNDHRAIIAHFLLIQNIFLILSQDQALKRFQRKCVKSSRKKNQNLGGKIRFFDHNSSRELINSYTWKGLTKPSPSIEQYNKTYRPTFFGGSQTAST